MQRDPAITIRRASGIAGALSRGSVVVIDVLRAFTTAAYAFAAGAEKIVLVSTPEEAFALLARTPDLLLAGEVGGRPIPGFHFGNSPAALRDADLSGRTLVLRSSSGTQGVVRATKAERIFLGSLVVAAATVRHVRSLGGEVTLLAMGSPHGPDGPEDEACADYMQALFSNARIERGDLARIARLVSECPAGLQALDPSIDWITPEDLACAIDIDRFDFCMSVQREGGLLVAIAQPTSIR